MYYRITYKNIGIYEELKKRIFNVNGFVNGKRIWNSLKDSNSFNWLNCPIKYPNNAISLFTEKGYKKFLSTVFNIVKKYFDKKEITLAKYELNGKPYYLDQYQVIIDKQKAKSINNE